MDISRIKSNIRAMLNLAADDASTPAEKEQAMRRVTELMDRHNLSEEDLADADGILDSLDNVQVGYTKVDLGVRQCLWMSALCVWVERLLGTVKTYSVRSEDRKSVHCVFYGVYQDCEIAAEIYFEVRDFIETACGTRYGGTKRGDGYNYCMGFVAGLQQQLEKLRSINPQLTEQRNALIVKRNEIVTKKHALAKRWANENGLKLHHQNNKVRIRKPDAFSNGFDDGSRYSVNTDRRKKLT